MVQEPNKQEMDANPQEPPADAPDGPGGAQAQVTRELEDLRHEVETLNDKYLRALADYQNLVKRTNAERVEWMDRAQAELVKAQLVILDDFERTLEAARSATDVKAVAEGVRIVYDKVLNTLGAFGVERVEVRKGDPFDPEYQQAMAQQPTDEVPPQHVLLVAQAGYRMKGRLLRPALVVVAAAKQKNETEEPGQA